MVETDLHKFLYGSSIENALKSRLQMYNMSQDSIKKIIADAPSNARSVMQHVNLSEYINQTISETARLESDGLVNPSEEMKTLAENKKVASYIKNVTKEATLSLVQQFYTQYMGSSFDAKYRLGTVTGVLDSWHSTGTGMKKVAKKDPYTGEIVKDENGNVVYEDVIDDAETASKNYTLPVTLQTDAYGRIYTRSNFMQAFDVEYYSSSAANSIKEDKDLYANLFFPPYFTNNEKVATLGEWAAFAEQLKSGTYVGTGAKVELSKMYNFRGGFTYRTPSFKSVNDNIAFFQWMLEKVTGICSTYLTEWDLSQYFQEGLNNDNSVSGALQYISLVHRVGDDHILPGQEKSSAYAYGVINAAVSKQYLTPFLRWSPGLYMLSPYWMSYPEWYQAADARSDEKPGVLIPTFYKEIYLRESQSGLNKNWSALARLQYDDFVGAATSGWREWRLDYYKALYSTPEDSISSVDVSHLNAANGYMKTQTLLDNVLSDVYGIALSSEDILSDSFNFRTFGSDQETVSNSSQGMSPGSSVEMSYFDATLKLLPSKSSKTGAAISAVNNASGNTSPAANSNNEDADLNSINLATADSVTEKFLGASSEDADCAPGLGVPQRNPVLYGGPHSPYHSPFTVQAYYEENNPFLRNVPRISLLKNLDPEIEAKARVFKSNDPARFSYPFFSGVEKWSSGNSGFENFSDIGPRNFERSFALGKNLLEKGIHTDVDAKATFSVTHYKTIELSWEGGSRVGNQEYPYFPSTVDGHSVSYLKKTIYTITNREKSGIFGAVTQSVESHEINDYWCESKSPQEISKKEYNKLLTSNVKGYNIYTFGGKYYKAESHVYATCFWTTTEERTYKRPIMHDMPRSKWRICQIQTDTAQVTVERDPTGWLSHFFTWWWGFSYRYILSIVSTQEKWKLEFPTSSVQRVKTVPSVGYPDFVFLHTTEEQEFLNKVVNFSGNGENSKAIFLGCDWSKEGDRYSKGPQYIFRAPVRHETFSFVYYYWQEHSEKHGCHRDYWYTRESAVGQDDILSVDIVNADYVLSAPQNGMWNNIYAKGNDLSTWQVSGEKGTDYTSDLTSRVKEYAQSTSFAVGETTQESIRSFEGIGVLSHIQGISPDAIDYPLLDEYTKQQLTVENHNIRGQDYAISRLPYKYCTLVEDRNSYESEYRDDAKFETILDHGAPRYVEESWDAGLRKAWTDICTSATFYTDNSFKDASTKPGANESFVPYYHISADAPIRFFFNCAVQQRSYLGIIMQLLGFIGEKETMQKVLSFDAIGKMIRGANGEAGIVSNKVLYLADPDQEKMIDPENAAKGTVIYKKKVFQYNQWINEALKIFTLDKEKNETNRRAVEDAIHERYMNLTEAINIVKNILSLPVQSWSTSQYFRVVETMNKCYKDSLNDDLIERFLLAYLNVLYEYRRFFINKRFNKQDGTLWLARHLESLLPMATWGSTTKAPAENPTQAYVDPELPVAFYEVDQTVATRLEAAKNGETVEDRIMYVYVPVEYGTKAQYEQGLKDFEEGRVDQLPYVKVLPWTHKRDKKTGLFLFGANGVVKEYASEYKYARKPKNRKYRLESKEFLKNLAAKNFNKNEPDETKHKSVDYEMDEAIWENIRFGLPDSSLTDEIGETDIVFDVYQSVNLSAAKELVDEGLTDPTSLICASKETADYWKIELPAMKPKASGYKTAVKLEPYSETATEVQKEEMEKAINGIMSNTLYPIVEDSPCIMPSEPEFSQIIGTTL